MPAGMNNLLTSITDGLGNATKISYRFLTDNSVYSKGQACAYPLVAATLPWPVVAAVDNVQRDGPTRTTEYRYADALLHKAGRGLLGFGSFTSTDKAANISETSLYEVNTDRYILGLKRQQSVWNGMKTLSESDYTNTLITRMGETGIFEFAPTETNERTFEFNSGETITDTHTTTDYDSYGNVTSTTTRSGDVTTVTDLLKRRFFMDARATAFGHRHQVGERQQRHEVIGL